jgi:hypothetical protein
MRFVVTPHSIIPGAEIVEVFDERGLIATIMEDRTAPRALKVISKYATGDTIIDRTSHPRFAADGRPLVSVSVGLGGP